MFEYLIIFYNEIGSVESIESQLSLSWLSVHSIQDLIGHVLLELYWLLGGPHTMYRSEAKQPDWINFFFNRTNFSLE